jgi:hypothetical protein
MCLSAEPFRDTDAGLGGGSKDGRESIPVSQTMSRFEFAIVGDASLASSTYQRGLNCVGQRTQTGRRFLFP